MSATTKKRPPKAAPWENACVYCGRSAGAFTSEHWVCADSKACLANREADAEEPR